MQIGKALIYAGSKEEVNLFDDWKLMIVCGDSFLAPKAKVFFSVLAEKILPTSIQKITVPPYIRLDWTDGQDPGLSVNWWETLVEALKDVDGLVSINCQGGHGRTGTALAILAHLSGACAKKADPVAWVRKAYCDEAVETLTQVEYVEYITETVVKAKPARLKPLPGYTTQPAHPTYGAGSTASASPGATDVGIINHGYVPNNAPEDQQPVGGEQVIGSEAWWDNRTRDW